MAEVVFTEQALSDINDIAGYISNDSIHYASLQVDKFFNKAEILTNFPLLGRIVPTKHKERSRINRRELQDHL